MQKINSSTSESKQSDRKEILNEKSHPVMQNGDVSQNNQTKNYSSFANKTL